MTKQLKKQIEENGIIGLNSVKNNEIKQFIIDFTKTYREFSILEKINKNSLINKLDLYALGKYRNVQDYFLNIQPTTNYISLLQEIKTSEILIDDIKFNVVPTIEKDITSANQLSKIVNKIFQYSNGIKALKTALKSSRLFPIGILKSEINNKKNLNPDLNIDEGDLIFSSVDIANFFWDTKFNNIEEMDFVFECKKFSLKMLKNIDLLKSNTEAFNYLQTLQEDYVNLRETNAEEYTKIYEERDYYNNIVYDSFYLNVVYFRYDYKNPKVAKIYMTDNVVLFVDEDTGNKTLPFVIFKEHEKAHDFFGYSSAELVLPSQQQLNEIDRIILNIGQNHSNPQKIVSVESNISPEMIASNASNPGAVFLTKGDVNNSIANVPNSPLPETLLVTRDSIIKDILTIGRVSKLDEGNTGSLTTTGGVSQALEANDSKNIGSQIEFKNNMLRLFKIMINQILTLKNIINFRIEAIDNDDFFSDNLYVKFNAKDYKDLKYNLELDIVSSKAEKNRITQQILQLLSLQTQTGVEYISPKDAIELLGLRNKELLKKHYDDRTKQKQMQELIGVTTNAVQMSIKAIEEGQGMENTNIQQIIATAIQKSLQEYQAQLQQQSGGGAQTQASQNGASGAANIMNNNS